jgi:hypothetical protein
VCACGSVQLCCWHPWALRVAVRPCHRGLVSALIGGQHGQIARRGGSHRSLQEGVRSWLAEKLCWIQASEDKVHAQGRYIRGQSTDSH